MGSKKAASKFKKIFFKIFGKARWFVLALVVSLSLAIAISLWSTAPSYLQGMNDVNGNLVHDIPLSQADLFSINDNGTAVVNSSATSSGIGAVINIDSGKQSYSGFSQVVVSTFGGEYFYPDNLVITDDNVIYGLKRERLNERSLISTKDTIVRLSEDYKYLGEVCSFEYDTSKRQRTSKLSLMHYYDGAVTFATIEKEGVYLYSIDTKTQAITKSDLYPTDPDGTYTTGVTPIDGSFIFIRSDGKLYDVTFNGPLDNCIYRYDIKADGESESPFINVFARVNGKLYVTDTRSMHAIYLLENGKLEKVFDVGNEDSMILSLDSYRKEGSSSESLVVNLDSGLMVYTDEELEQKNPIIHFSYLFTVDIEEILELVTWISLQCLLINLIIRKKTLLYKQLILIIPIFVILAIVVSVKVYIYSDKNLSERLDNELTIICDLGKSEFDDYDFSDLMKIDEDTGAAYNELVSKLNKLSSAQDNDWSMDYVFSVVYKADNGDMVILAGDDRIYTPMRFREKAKFNEVSSASDELFTDNEITSFFSDNYVRSTISVLGQIDDKNDTGRYYLKVSSDKGALFSQRSDILLKVFLYTLLAISVLTMLIVLSFLNTQRVIKKATKTVKEISKGDLSARIDYKSKDELGEICSQVNEMGQSLEKLFAEKDETEKFYYKFVPEKFRELLGKEKFTDLALGDAKSCELTVLFCDIRSFSINSEMMTAKENFSFVNVIYGKMGPLIREHKGFIDKYIGDAIMALFENADDAVKCGIELYKAIVLDPKTAEELNVSDINIGIGIHSGMAMAGIVGEEERLAGTVISDTVNLSSRLESLTKQYKTAMLVSKDTIDRLNDPDSLDLRYLGIVQVAGVNEVKAIYEVLDCLPEDSRTIRSSNRSELREAIRLFSLGRRDGAVKALQSIKGSGKNDHVTDMYLDYIRDMSDDDKGNVFRFVRK